MNIFVRKEEAQVIQERRSSTNLYVFHSLRVETGFFSPLTQQFHRKLNLFAVYFLLFQSHPESLLISNNCCLCYTQERSFIFLSYSLLFVFHNASSSFSLFVIPSLYGSGIEKEYIDS